MQILIISTILVAFIAGFVHVFRTSNGPAEKIMVSIFAACMFAVTFFLTLLIVVPLTGGVWSNYKTGQMEQVYISEVWTNGWYNTTEARGFIGEDSKNFVEVRLSTKDESVGHVLRSSLNQRINVDYDVWFLKPAFFAESNQIVGHISK